MRKCHFFLLIAAFVAASDIAGCPARGENGLDVERYLPGKSEISGWTDMSDPRTARGEDLYLLIDGAAEIFLEYGFRQAVMQSYGNGSGKSINLEIYEMEDTTGAYGIYTFRTGKGGEAISVGNEGLMEDYYLNFWKGRILVTVIGFGTDEETVGGMMAVARAVEARIEEEGGRPRLAGLLPVNGLKPEGIKFIRGNLALFNIYEFDSADIFGLSEGVFGTYGDHRIFLFSYDDENECRKWFLKGVNSLKTNPRFHDLALHANGCSTRDKNGIHLRIEPYRRYIIIILGVEKNAGNLMARQRAIIDNFDKTCQ